MTIRTRLSLWYATIMFVSLLAMGVLTYRQFASERRKGQRQQSKRTKMTSTKR